MTDADLKSVVAAFFIQAITALAVFAAFSILRYNYKQIYEPRLRSKEEIQQENQAIGLKTLIRIKVSLRDLTTWIPAVLSIDEAKMSHHIGLDSVMFLAFLRLCCRFFGVVALISLPLMVFNSLAPSITGLPGFQVTSTVAGQDPPPSSSNSSSSSNSTSSGSVLNLPNPQLTTLTFQNLNAAARGWFWLYVVVAYVYTFVGYYLIFATWRQYLRLRRAWFGSQSFQQSFHNRTVLLTNLPPSLQTDEALTDFIKTLDLRYPFVHAMVGRKIEKLPALISEYERTMALLERSLCKSLPNANSTLPRLTHRQGGLFGMGFLGGKRVETLPYCQQRLHELEEEIYAVRARGELAFECEASGFVLFETAMGAHDCARRYRTPTSISFKTKMLSPPTLKLAPHFEDIIWANIGISMPFRQSRRLVAVGITIALILAWTFIVATATTLTSIESLARISPAISQFVQQNEVANALFKAVVAPVVLVVLGVVLQLALQILAHIQGVRSNTGAQKSVLHKYFAFQIYQVVFLVALKTLSMALTSFLTGNSNAFASYDLSAILSAASAGFINSSSYYIAFITVSFSSYAIEIIQGARLAMLYVKRIFFKPTPREEGELNQLPVFEVTFAYSNLLLIFLLGSTYCIIAPLTTVFAFIVFYVAYLVMRYQLSFVYETEMETGGSWWPKVSNLLLLCFGFWQTITLIGFLFVTNTTNITAGAGTTVAQGILMLILPLLTVAYWYCIHTFLAPKGYLLSEVDDAPRSYLAIFFSAVGKHLTGAFFVQLYKPWTYVQSLKAIPVKETGDAADDRKHIEQHAFNPSLEKPLWTLTLPPELQPRAAEFYQPRYKDLADFMAQNQIESPASADAKPKYLQGTDAAAAIEIVSETAAPRASPSTQTTV
ncbi:uncharacterized protein BJ171DRAFT_520098 [Polychytrium aggregatum]|uniref:uncharacterized protein n=1 Tax=Polychytrium aggregatum TaxID=110093 RepID=UPI0022FE331C|nr:uncharacterized protein BJ171DRAFT_520098 [Polychytrium aggregatum]KAI9197374.1 hypothetical protein BJ171DRAFT_520098 [Polychytrium aggregatum]